MQKEQLEGFKLSPHQKHLWLLQQNESQLPYRVQCAITITGNLNIDVLKTVLKNVINQYEILRTNFHCLPGMTVPLQVIAETSDICINKYINEFNFIGLPQEEQENKIESLFAELKGRPFQLEKDLPLQIYIITLSPTKYILMLSLSALIADTFTLKVLLKKISSSYVACLGDKHILDEPMQYADIAQWQNELLESKESELGKEYWRKQDVSLIDNVKLWFENKQIAISPFQPEYLSLNIGNDFIKQIESITKIYKVNNSDFLLACWLILLWKITRQSDIFIGITGDGRKYEELNQALGLLSKHLPHFYHLEAEFKFSEILKKVHKLVNNAYEWQEYFIWQETVNSQSFCPISFEFEEYPELSAGNLSFSLYNQYSCIDKFKIKLTCLLQSDNLIAQFYFDSKLYNLQDIKTLSEQFQNLLASAIQNPESSIARLNILGDRQRQQLLIELNNTQKQYPQDKCIHQIFEEQAEQTPDKIAVVFEEQQLTYYELNTRANQLANYLQSQGVKPEVLVGVYLERSLEIVIALLAILKAGGAYLPLDPALPPEGLAYRLQDAQVPVILTQGALVKKIPDLKTQIVSLDTNWEVIAQERTSKPNNFVTTKNLVYVLFTSGSTGKPKGVAVEHQQLVNYVNAIKERLNLSVCNRFATVSTFAADLGNTVIFPALCTGGCLYLVSPEYASNPEVLADYFHRHSIDCLKIVPSHLSGLLTSSDAAKILPRKRLILGGEASSWKLIEQIQQLAPECLIFNHYGPTEATVGVLTYPIKLEETIDYSGNVPLGRPIANTQIYILDSLLQPVPIGVPGELYLGGAGVARCYLNRPELTNEKFISNPFGETQEIGFGQRLYKTGDLARYLPDGNIEFLGRIDNQVKIHGFRIELGEIESALRRHSNIRETVVLAREDTPGNKCLVAYVVAEKQFIPTTAELRDFLQDKLPSYMVPSTFIRLKALPLLPNGKVNRQGLPAPDSRSDLADNFVAPRTTAEKTLATIWARILKLEIVGIYHNFFELGGDSILSMQIIAKANQAGLQLTPKQFFEHQTIAGLAAIAVNNKVIEAEQGLVTGSVPLTPIQRWFFEQNFPQMHHWNQAVLLEVRQALSPLLLAQAVKQLLKHHDALRLRYNCYGTDTQQVNSEFDEVVPFTLFDLSTLAERELKSAISNAATTLHTSLNLNNSPLLRVALFDLGTGKSQRLLIIIHHLVIDGISWRVLLEDLQTAYQQLSQGEAIVLPPKTTSFKHWAQRLQEYTQSQVIPQELNYWLTKIPRQTVRLPVDFFDGDNTVALAESISVTLSQEETQTLLQKVSATYQTQINDVLLTVLIKAVEKWIGVRSLLVDLEGHGREEIFDDVDLSRTLGWFSTIFPVFLDIRETNGIESALEAIKTQLRSIPNRGIGYGLLRYLGGEEAAALQGCIPKAEIRFNYLGQSDQLFGDSSLFIRAEESTETERSLLSKRSYLIDVTGIVTGGQLQINWTYSKAIHHRATIERLAESFMEQLQEIIAHCQSFKTEEHPSVLSAIPSVTQTETSMATSKITLEVLNAEAVLDSTIRAETSFEYPNQPSHIFLTGATGFVGAFLLYELLQQTNANIYCLVRAANTESGKKKLQKHLESYLIWDESLSNRIIPVIGDLSEPLLGLSEQQFKVMAQKIDVIYHNAAAINLVYSYSALKATNVLGTQEILRLASQIKVKPVHYISTLSVLSSEGHAQVKKIQELHNFSHSQIPSGGYAQTKWVAEKLVSTAHNRGIPVSIYRLGRVSGHSKTGVCNRSDRLYRMLKGFIQMKCAPNVDTTVDMTPVDYVSKAIIHLSRQKQSLDKIFHLSNQQPIGSFELFKWIREFGYSLLPMAYNQWQTELLNASESSLDNPLYPLIPFFAGTNTEDASEQTSKSTELKLDCQNTTDGLANTSIVCPPVDAKLLNTYFSYLIQSGFFDPPQ
ncbi:MAG: amino acid adenylation domain-containing protein [Nostocales cyanobacterium 94392]|nr:amino acid adenylation domain-containing protein [Nostocales cyanobacterium 94392]